MSNFWRNTNTFFKQNSKDLLYWRDRMIEQLKDKSFNSNRIIQFCIAYDYFAAFPSKYDGSTFSRDLHDIYVNKNCKLDFAAMLHDYISIKGAKYSYKKWFKESWKHSKTLNKLGKGYRIDRFLGLCFLGIFFVTINKIK